MTGARPSRSLRRRDPVGQDADALDLGLELVALLEELAEGGADALGRAGGDDVAGQQREALREHRDALVHREDHLGGVARLPRLAVHAQGDVEGLRIGDLVAVTSTGPIGQNVSSDLPLNHCWWRFCRSRAVTSLTMV